MPTGSESRTRQAGLIAAALLAVVFIAVVGYFVMTGGPGPGAPPIPPDLDLRPPDTTAGAGPNQADIGATEGADIHVTDTADPTRVTARLRSRTTEPLPEHRYELTGPEAWIYAKDGRTVHISADRARVYQPVRGEAPESGTLTGNVVISLYAARPGRPLDVGNDTPEFVATTGTLSFDLNLWEATTEDRVVGKGDQVEFAVTGVRAVFNEVRERLELLDIKQGEYIKYHGALAGTRASRPTVRPLTTLVNYRPARQAEARPQPSKPAPPATDSFYHVTFDKQVEVHQVGREFTADRLQLWAHLVDNRLPAGAIAPLFGVATPTPSAPPPLPDRSVATPPAASSAAKPPASAPSSRAAASTPVVEGPDPVVMTWAGPCTLRPLDERPSQLARDDMALRATAEEAGLVTFAAPDRNASGHCAMLEYGLTSRNLLLSGVGPSSVTLTAGDSGRFELVRATLDLSAGLVRFDGPGVARQVSGRQLSWTKSGDLVLRMDGDRVTSNPQEGLFVGAVQVTDGTQTVRGETLRAEFAAGADGRSVLKKVHIEDPARVAASAADSSLRALSIELALDPASDPENPSPSHLSAAGNVEAKNKDSTLTGEHLEADLARDTSGGVIVTDATVKGNVNFAQRGTSAHADQVHAIPPAETVDLTGDGAFVTRDGTRIAAPQLHLDGKNGIVNAFGPWTFEHSAGGTPSATPQVRAAGVKSLTFDDSTGIAECAGAVIAVHSPAPLRTDTLKSERVKLELTPNPGGGSPDLKNRTLFRATAIGGVREIEGGGNAKVESRRFAERATAPNGRRLDRMLYLEAPEILASQTDGTLDVNDPGRLLLVDQRETPTDTAAPGAAAPLAERARGDALFDWDGSMHLDRAKGTLVMSRNVRLTHRPLESGETVNLVCESLRGTVESATGKAPADEEGDLDLVAADAEGAVYVAAGPPGGGPTKELAADHVHYDARRGVLTATAAPGNTVTMFDSARATPLTAAALEWDLRRDQVRITRPGTMTLPVGVR
ncbi:MAG: LPS export ABC transporter periplasmic protein LptC [Phycisphaerales bacterium]|nr:LPS export ABC transporter periplasmic protein LptC [Phycisphaerales bacterium]